MAHMKNPEYSLSHYIRPRLLWKWYWWSAERVSGFLTSLPVTWSLSVYIQLPENRQYGYITHQNREWDFNRDFTWPTIPLRVLKYKVKRNPGVVVPVNCTYTSVWSIVRNWPFSDSCPSSNANWWVIGPKKTEKNYLHLVFLKILFS